MRFIIKTMNQHDFLIILIREDIERHILYEGLIYTYSLEMLLPELYNLGFKKNDFEFNSFNNVIKVNFTLNDDNEKRYLELNRIMENVGGWFHGSSIAGSILKNKLDFIKEPNGQIILQYEPKFDISVATPEKLYHLTKQNKLGKIKKNGLTPRSSIDFFNFKDRIYFSINKNSLEDFAKQKKQIELNNIYEKERALKYKSTKQKNVELEQTGKFIILTIKPNWGRINTRFFKNPNFFDGFYTKENISPFAIMNIENLDV